MAGVALAALLALGVATSGAVADDLDDQKAHIEENIQSLEGDLEYLDADIRKTAAQLKDYQSKLPAAEAALAEAQGRVQAAADEVGALAARVELAQESRGQIARQVAEDEAKYRDVRKAIGQIATQAYKRGGVSGDLTLILEAASDGDLANGIDLADQAMRSQNAALDRLGQQGATDRNAQARLAAVEEEIVGLKARAEAALEREQAARDEAEESKREVDALVTRTEELTEELAAKRPKIQARLAAQEAEHAAVLADIKARQEKLLREAEARRKAEEAAARKRNAGSSSGSSGSSSSGSSSSGSSSKPQTSVSGWGLIRPTAGGYITSRFGWRPTPAGTIDYGGRGGYVHAGVDWGFGGACGAPIRAAASGEVWFAAMSASSGNKVTVSHGVVNGHALATNYHHMSSYVVSPGQRVGRGQVIGYVGTTGNSTGCHLHFETILDGSAVDPLGLL
ncbi:metalloendopeptidase [Zafaria cholistanensis]|uniref:Metalloendopeptidase n=2 Tax=Zafaria cholistanensis TaxID=1682741 RepID=A0A5A7NT24_9MICC|nr:metalloendopeptidase [Zafaria cholistanensis]